MAEAAVRVDRYDDAVDGEIIDADVVGYGAADVQDAVGAGGYRRDVQYRRYGVDGNEVNA